MILRTQKGAVLILVLWVIAFLSMIGGYFTLETTLKRNLGFNPWNLLRAKLAINSALLVIAPHIKPFGQEEENQDQFIVPDGTHYKISIGGQNLKFSIEDERGKIDLNKAPDEMIEMALQGLLGKEEGEILSDSILDWKDNDQDERTNGAEKDYYLSLRPSYEPSDSKFILLDQLLLVRGVSPDLYWGPLDWKERDDEKEMTTWTGGIKDLFTIYNGTDKLISEAAPKPLIDILEKEYFKEANGLGTLRFKACAYQSCYQIFFKKETGSKLGFRLVYWGQAPRI